MGYALSWDLVLLGLFECTGRSYQSVLTCGAVSSTVRLLSPLRAQTVEQKRQLA